jgi:hypothetical protein
MLHTPTETQKQESDFSLAGKLWYPGSNVFVVDGDDKDIANEIDFKKDAKRNGLHVSDQHSAVLNSLQMISAIPKDVANVLTLKKKEEIITACNFAEDRGYKAFIQLGRMVLATDEKTAAEHPLTIKIGDVWDRTDYSGIVKTTEELNKELQGVLALAFDAWEKVEDEWDDERGDAAKKKNSVAIRDWVDRYTIKLTEATRQLHYSINTKRKLEEVADNTSKYKSLGEAIKAKDETAFIFLFKKQKYEANDDQDMEMVQRLMPHIVDANMVDGYKTLVKWGAPSNAKNKEGQSYFMKAVVAGNLDIARELDRQNGRSSDRDFNDNSALVLAVKAGNLEAVKMLVEEIGKGANNDRDGINASCLLGYTPLVYAVSENNAEISQYLIKMGANPTHKVIGEDNATIDQFTNEEEIEEMLENAINSWNSKKGLKPSN